MAPYFLHWHAGHDLAQSEVLLCMKKGQSLALSGQKALHGPEHEVSTSPLKKGVATMHPVHLLVNTKAIYKKGRKKKKKEGKEKGVRLFSGQKECMCHRAPTERQRIGLSQCTICWRFQIHYDIMADGSETLP